MCNSLCDQGSGVNLPPGLTGHIDELSFHFHDHQKPGRGGGRRGDPLLQAGTVVSGDRDIAERDVETLEIVWEHVSDQMSVSRFRPIARSDQSGVT